MAPAASASVTDVSSTFTTKNPLGNLSPAFAKISEPLSLRIAVRTVAPFSAFEAIPDKRTTGIGATGTTGAAGATGAIAGASSRSLVRRVGTREP